MIVQVTADNPVRYSLDNGITMTEFMPNEHYSVPDYAGRAMIARGWARPAQPHEAPPAEPEPSEAVLQTRRRRDERIPRT